MRTIVFNTTNITSTDNNVLVYNFPNSVVFDNHSIALASASMYYSWFNISALLGNNIFTYTWTVAGTTTTYTVTIPDGLYEISTINAYLQFDLISRGMYLINASSQNVYYIQFVVNTATYKIDINTFPVPTSLPATYTAPAAFPGYPTTTRKQVVTLPLAFNKIMGFTAGYATTAESGLTTNQTYSSTITPQVQPNPSILFSLSNIDNKYANPTSIFYSLSPSVAIGALITERPANFIWNSLIKGTYNQLRMTILGANLQPIKIQDPAITIILAIKENSEL